MLGRVQHYTRLGDLPFLRGSSSSAGGLRESRELMTSDVGEVGTTVWNGRCCVVQVIKVQGSGYVEVVVVCEQKECIYMEQVGPSRGRRRRRRGRIYM